MVIVHLGALDVAAVPVRPIDGSGLAAVYPAGAGEYCCHGAGALDAGEMIGYEMIVKRDKLNFWERLYLPAIIGGLQGHHPPFLQKESDDAISGGKMDRAARVIAARRIW